MQYDSMTEEYICDDGQRISKELVISLPKHELERLISEHMYQSNHLHIGYSPDWTSPLSDPILDVRNAIDKIKNNYGVTPYVYPPVRGTFDLVNGDLKESIIENDNEDSISWNDPKHWHHKKMRRIK